MLQYGFPPKSANYLIAYGKKKNYPVNYKQVDQLMKINPSMEELEMYIFDVAPKARKSTVGAPPGGGLRVPGQHGRDGSRGLPSFQRNRSESRRQLWEADAKDNDGGVDRMEGIIDEMDEKDTFSDSDDDDDPNQLIGDQHRLSIIRRDRDKMPDWWKSRFNKTRLVRIGKVPGNKELMEVLLPNFRKLSRRNTKQDKLDKFKAGVVMRDRTSFEIVPFFPNLVLSFHLDIVLKDWNKVKKEFFSSVEKMLGMKTKHYKMLTIAKHPKHRVETILNIVLEKEIDHWPSRHTEATLKQLKEYIDDKLSPLVRSFRDAGWLLKMLQDLTFAQLDPTSSNSVKYDDFATFFDKNSVEPLEPATLEHLFKTLDVDGDGQVNAREFFRWKTGFTIDRLVGLYPIRSVTVDNSFYASCGGNDGKMFNGFDHLANHIYHSLQDHPLTLEISKVYYLDHIDKFQNYLTYKQPYKNSRLFFSVCQTNEISYILQDLSSLPDLTKKASERNDVLKSVFKGFKGEKGHTISMKIDGSWGEGYYLTPQIQYALKDAYFKKIKNKKEKKSGEEWTVVCALANLGRCEVVHNAYAPGKKGKVRVRSKYHSIHVPKLRNDWRNEKEFGKPYDPSKRRKDNASTGIGHILQNTPMFGLGASFNRSNNPNDSQDMSGILDDDPFEDDGKERAIGQTYDDFVVKDHTRILPRYLVTFKRTKKVFVWVDEKYDNIKSSMQSMISTRLTGKQFIPSIAYGGDDLYRIKKLVELKSQFANIFLLKFCGRDSNNALGWSDIGFIEDIVKTVGNVNERIKKTQGKDVSPVLLTLFEVVIKYDVFTKKQRWELHEIDENQESDILIEGSRRKVFQYINDHITQSKSEVARAREKRREEKAADLKEDESVTDNKKHKKQKPSQQVYNEDEEPQDAASDEGRVTILFFRVNFFKKELQDKEKRAKAKAARERAQLRRKLSPRAGGGPNDDIEDSYAQNYKPMTNKQQSIASQSSNNRFKIQVDKTAGGGAVADDDVRGNLPSNTNTQPNSPKGGNKNRLGAPSNSRGLVVEEEDDQAITTAMMNGK